jgi:putative ABC transport system substrate-binding protein
MRRREVIAGACFLAATSFAAAQSRVAHIALLSIGTDPDPARPNPVWVAFLQGMAALGWVEGPNLIVERRFAGGEPQLVPRFVAELSRLRLDAVVVTAELEATAARDAMPGTAIVMLLVADPVRAGLAASLARPGGTVTGLSTLAPEAYGKRLQLLKEAVPGLTRVGVLFNPVPAYAELALRHTELAAHDMGIEVRRFAVSSPDTLDPTLQSIADEQLQAIIVVTDGVTYIQRAHIAQWAAAARIIAMYENRNFIDSGGLIAYGPSYSDLARRGATYVHRIIAGVNPADLPIEQPTRFELLINLKAAAALGLRVEPSLVARADEVIE